MDWRLTADSVCRADSFKSLCLLTYHDSKSFGGSQKANRYGRHAPRSQRYTESIVTVHILDILQMVLLSRTKQITVGVDRGHIVRKSEVEREASGESRRTDKRDGEGKNTVYRREWRKIKMCVFNWWLRLKVHSCRLIWIPYLPKHSEKQNTNMIWQT